MTNNQPTAYFNDLWDASEEGKLILIFLREITTREKGNKLQINK